MGWHTVGWGGVASGGIVVVIVVVVVVVVVAVVVVVVVVLVVVVVVHFDRCVCSRDEQRTRDFASVEHACHMQRRIPYSWGG